MTGFPTNKALKAFFRRFRLLMDELGSCEERELADSVRLGGAKIRFPRPLPPIRIQVGGEEGKLLHLHPEPVLDAEGRAHPSGAYLLYNPEDQAGGGLHGFVRLRPGETMVLGREDEVQQALLHYPSCVSDCHLSVKLKEEGLVFKDLASPHATCVSPLPLEASLASFIDWRLAKLRRLTRIFGERPLEPLPRDEAQTLIEAAIAHLEREPHRALDREGRPGGAVILPDTLFPVFVGDLHARIDNLLTLLTQNGFLEGLVSGQVALLILGDAVHPDTEGQEAAMDSSLLIMDLIFRLMLAFPGQVFYLRGNHDSFSESISKGGVPQGILWEQALRDGRGAKYLQAMTRVYELLPYVAWSERFLACHAGAPSGKISRQHLIDLRQHPKLERELITVRLRRPNSPQGYGPGDVKRLRRRLELAPETPFIVGHTPLSPDDTLWLDAGGIPNHHVVFGAQPDWVGVIAMVGDRFLALRYPVEPLTALYNHLLPSRQEAA